MFNSLWQAFQMGGMMMYVIFALGLVALAAAARFARRGEHQLIRFLQWMIASLVATGLLGFITGMQLVLKAAAKVESGQAVGDMKTSTHVLIVGTREALSCASAGGLFVALILILTAVGLRRFPQPNASAQL